MLEEVSQGDEGLQDVGKHVVHALVDASPVWDAVDQFAILGEGKDVKHFPSAVPTEVSVIGTVVEAFIERSVLWSKIDPQGEWQRMGVMARATLLILSQSNLPVEMVTDVVVSLLH